LTAVNSFFKKYSNTSQITIRWSNGNLGSWRGSGEIPFALRAFPRYDPDMPALAESRKSYTISELTKLIRSTLEDQVGKVWVEGEVSNLRRQASGHQYFSLKDDRAQLRCVLFRGNDRAGFALEDGMQVLAHGDISVYEAQGQYQLIVRTIQPKGLGALQARFEALKRKLDAEGLFRQERKKRIPRLPRTIALVTSPSSAAIRDMLNILQRRAPWVRLLIVPVRVQGEGAAEEIAHAIRWISSIESPEIPPIDTLIVGRGGGSIEDLWNFNEEIVARAIADCPLPTVAAVGHEIDFTIADFVADLRAPTPSAAAELVVPDRADIAEYLERVGSRLRHQVRTHLEHVRKLVELLSLSGAFQEPGRLLAERAQRVDELEQRLREGTRLQLRDRRERIAHARRLLELSRPERIVRQWRERIESMRERLEAQPSRHIREFRQQVASLASMLRTLGPEAVLSRGYSLTSDAEGNVLTSVRQIETGHGLITRLSDGAVHSSVDEVQGRTSPASTE